MDDSIVLVTIVPHMLSQEPIYLAQKKRRQSMMSRSLTIYSSLTSLTSSQILAFTTFLLNRLKAIGG